MLRVSPSVYVCVYGHKRHAQYLKKNPFAGVWEPFLFLVLAFVMKQLNTFVCVSVCACRGRERQGLQVREQDGRAEWYCNIPV